nr:hypothetical protein BaRGS_004442 [Batillaria attramentaria]
MHKGAMRTTAGTMGGGGVTVMRPPKPPCWRDFVTQDPRRDYPASSSLTTADVRGALGAGDRDYSPGGGGGVGGEAVDSYVAGGGRLQFQYAGLGGGPKAGKSGKRVRARIHRTRSEHLIDVEDLPEGDLTVSLADTRPHELRLRVRPAADLDERLYVEENNRRCQSWLASIEAAEPLDDIGYTQGKDEEEVGLEAVDVEVPEETFSWKEEDGEGEQLQPPFNTSASSSDSDGLLQHVMAAVGYDPDDEDSGGEDVVGGGKDSRDFKFPKFLPVTVVAAQVGVAVVVVVAEEVGVACGRPPPR